ncbi:MAG: PQQ-binding-like beta-propeller repeat protein [Bacteroidetes bacterium]|nr:PQQ-binding-like beta-propeller repeat protein [Bacteroidota bacterium]
MWKALVICCLIPIALMGQDASLELSLTLRDLKGAPMPSVEIVLVETSTKDEMKGMTNAKGVVKFSIKEGHQWAINFLDVKEYALVELPPGGVRTQERTMTYVPPQLLEKEEPFDRTGVVFTEARQYANSKTQASKTHDFLVIRVVDRQKKPQKAVKIELVSVEQRKKYTAQTDVTGFAYFLLPAGYEYEIDLPGLEAHKKVEMPIGGYVTTELELLYVPTQVDETAANDTITQRVPLSGTATSERAFMKVRVVDFDQNGLANEPVYWDDELTDNVYTALTDDNGYACFLLPKKSRYSLHLTYEREIRVFDLSDKHAALTNAMIQITYRGSDVIETFYNTTKRSPEGFVMEFMSTPIQPGTVTNTYLQKLADGFTLNFETGDPLYTPLVTNGKIYTSHGFYSNSFSCFHAETGDMIWTVALGEGGASPAAFFEGYILLITESCTLYLIDGQTGELAWSKWLSPYLLSSPTVANGKVYTVYKNDITEAQNTEKEFVLACFDLKTGNILWQKWVNGEGLSSPVVYGGSVFLSTQKGSLYQFESSQGTLIKELPIDAVSAPTIDPTGIYISIRHQQTGQRVCRLDDSWKMTMVAESGSWLPPAFDRMESMLPLMAYEGSRCLVGADHIYFTIDNEVYCYGKGGKLAWKKTLAALPDTLQYGLLTMPILSGSKLVVGSKEGKLFTLDAKTGNTLSAHSLEVPIGAQPALVGGRMYVPGVGQLRVWDTKDQALSNWPMWNGNPGHNPVIN